MLKRILLPLLAITPLIADDLEPSPNSCEEINTNKGTASVRHREANGIGYSNGYSSFDLFYTPSLQRNIYPFIDLRAHVFNDGRPAFNTGLGLRFLPECSDVVYGVHAYWDYRRAKHSVFHQASLGLEALWPRFDIRLNGYAPFNRHKRGFKNGFSHFKGNNAFFFRKYVLAMSGGDLAMGYWFYKGSTVSMYAGLDGYYFQGDYGKHAGGGLFRSKLRFSDYITLEGQVSYDSLFKLIGQGEVSLHVPFGNKVKRTERCSRSCNLIDLEDRLSKRPDRFEIIVTTTHKKHGRALDPLTGKPLKFIFVDNTSSSNGTFESPFPTLAQAVAVATVDDAIYIFPGDGTSKGLNTATILKDGQWLLGSGAPIAMTTRFGTISIPKLTNNRPIITVPVGNAVTIGNQNTISGLQIIAMSASSTAVTTTAPSANLTLINCELGGEGSNGIGINVSLHGPNNIIQDNDMIFGTTLAAVGIIFEGNATGSVNFSRNRIVGLIGPTTGFAVIIQPHDNSVSTMVIEDNVIDFQPNANDIGLFLIGRENSIHTATVRNNRITSFGPNVNVGLGILTETTAQITANLESNQVNVVDDSIGIAVAPIDSSTIILRLANNISSAPGSTQTPFAGPIFGGTTTNDYSLHQVSPTFFVESPNGQLSGVESINTGRFSQQGLPLFFFPE